MDSGGSGIRLDLMIELLPILQSTRRSDDYDPGRPALTTSGSEHKHPEQDKKAAASDSVPLFADVFHFVLFLTRCASLKIPHIAFNLQSAIVAVPGI
jgi:hypothetical protein